MWQTHRRWRGRVQSAQAGRRYQSTPSEYQQREASLSDKNSYVLPDSVKRVVHVSLIAENVFGEMTELDRQPVDVEASGTGRHRT